MPSSITRKLKLALKAIPGVRTVTQRNDRRKRFATELALIRGRHHTDNQRRSIIHFSFNKAATQYVKSLLRRAATANGMTPVGIHDYAFHSKFPYLDLLSAEEFAPYKHIFRPHGYLYSVFGGMIDGIPDLPQYKVILVARDPRDILVSNYFSIAYSHVAPSSLGDKYDTFVSSRQAARASTIDEYVRTESDKLYDNYSRYERLLLAKHTDVHLTTYEQMVADFETWLTQLIRYCGFDLSDAFVESLLVENRRKRPEKENRKKHLRKGQPGDYREKLQPATIEYLNKKFRSILNTFQYQ